MTTYGFPGFTYIPSGQNFQTLESTGAITKISLREPTVDIVTSGWKPFYNVAPKTEENFNYIWPVPLKSISTPTVAANFITQASTGEPPVTPIADPVVPPEGSQPSQSTTIPEDSIGIDVASIRDLSQDFSYASMYKIDPPEDDPVDGMEVSNTVPSLKNYKGTSMFFDMVDSTNQKKGIVVPGANFQVCSLKLTPNPSTLSISSTKKINRYTTMSGWVEEHWGDDIDTISFSGTTFAFFGNDSEKQFGLTNVNAEQTDAYKFLKELIHFFQVNGCIYQGNDYSGFIYPESVTTFLKDNPEFINNHPRKGMIKERLYIRMNYDYLTLYGRFDTFDVAEASTGPFRNTFNAVFKAEKTIYNLMSAPL